MNPEDERLRAVAKFWPNPTPCHHCDEPQEDRHCWWCGKPQLEASRDA